MTYYESGDGTVFTIGELWNEYEDLKLFTPDGIPDDFEEYINECLSDGALQKTTMKTFEYETIFASVGRSIKRLLDAFKIKYKLEMKSNLIWHFDITATDTQKEGIEDYIKEVV